MSKTLEYLFPEYESWSEWGDEWLENQSLGELRDYFAALADKHGEDSHLFLATAKGCRCLSCYQLQIVDKDFYNIAKA